MSTLPDQVVIVTGAARGLGRHIAMRLAREGARVALCARTAAELESLASDISGAGGACLVVPTDLRRRNDISRCVESVHAQWGPVDILVNNAGIGTYKPFMDHSVTELDDIIDINFKGTVFMTRAVLPDMLEQGRGQILNVASDLSRRVIPNMAAYIGAKHAVLGFSQSLLREVKDRGVKVMTLSPGIIDTYFGGAQEGSKEETWALQSGRVADLVVYMLTQPPYVVMDEVVVHPLKQDF